MASSLSIEAGAKDKLRCRRESYKASATSSVASSSYPGRKFGLLSTASLMLGIGAAREDQESMIISGVSGALACACGMAVGEFVSVSTQRDIEKSLMRKCNSDGDLCRGVGDMDSINLQISGLAHPTVAESGKTKANMVSTIPRRIPLVKLMPCNHEPFQGKISPTIQQIQLSPYSASPSSSAVMKGIVSDNATATILHDSGMQDDSSKDALPNPYKASAFLCDSYSPCHGGCSKQH